MDGSITPAMRNAYYLAKSNERALLPPIQRGEYSPCCFMELVPPPSPPTSRKPKSNTLASRETSFLGVIREFAVEENVKRNAAS
ncbi:hypothetical protein QOT17_010610 [Balamuthia mandrillaris]